MDILLENAAGDLVGIEVKAASMVAEKDFAGLHALAEDAGRRLLRGFVLYAGERAVRFGERYTALPITALWQGSG